MRSVDQTTGWTELRDKNKNFPDDLVVHATSFSCLFNILISLGNQSIQTEVGERQQEIAQTIQLETLNRQLVTVLAGLAVKTNDEQLKKVLADSGVNPGNAPEGAPAKSEAIAAEESDNILEREETLEDSAVPQPVSDLPFIIHPRGVDDLFRASDAATRNRAK